MTDTPISRPRLIKRHGVVVRITHWINALCLGLLLMSGLQIFNAHPALYIGQKSTFKTPLFAIDSREVAGKTEGYTASSGIASTRPACSVCRTWTASRSNAPFRAGSRCRPPRISEPGRKWHFLMAWLLVINGLVYLAYGLISRHFARDIVPDRADLAHTGEAIVDHLKLKFPHGENARRYNVLQKLAYAGVIFVALPLIVLAGWTMSPGLDAVFSPLLTLFGGRQTARTVHFVVAFGLVAFVVVHVAMVLLTGVFNNMRAMITGWFDLGVAKDGEATSNG